MSDARTTPPSFEEMVGLIEKLFKDFLQSQKCFTDDEIEEGWRRYKTLNHLYQDSQPPAVKGVVWYNVNDRPLITKHDNGRWSATDAGSNDFIAAVPYKHKDHGDKIFWWVHHCVIDKSCLCVVGEDDNEPAGWEIDGVEYWMPWPQNPDESPTAARYTEEALFEQYHAIKEKIGKLCYNTFINSKEVEDYREWLRNGKYKHRLEWFEKEFPNGLYSKDDDGDLFGINIITKTFLAEADAAYERPTAAGDGKEQKAFAEWLYKNRWYSFSANTGDWHQTLEHPSAMGQKTYEKHHVKTTTELYNIFKNDGNGKEP